VYRSVTRWLHGLCKRPGVCGDRRARESYASVWETDRTNSQRQVIELFAKASDEELVEGLRDALYVSAAVDNLAGNIAMIQTAFVKYGGDPDRIEGIRDALFVSSAAGHEEVSDWLSGVVDNYVLHHWSGPAHEGTPVVKDIIATKEILDQEGRCSICLEEVEADTKIVQLPCLHWYDRSCAIAWLFEHGTCPMCRRDYSETIDPNYPWYWNYLADTYRPPPTCAA
jgi:hypothetical protein